MEFIVTQNESDIKVEDIVVDSSFSEKLECIRIDHHVDNGLTNIDSVFMALKEGVKLNNLSGRIVTSAVDTDSIITAAIIQMLLDGEMDVGDERLVYSDLFKTLYSACFWCDYNTNYERFNENINDNGELLDLYIREEMQIYIGLSYREKVVTETQNDLFAKQVKNIKSIFNRGKLPLHILKFPREEVYEEIEEAAQKCIMTDISKNDIIGYIKTPDNEHLLPRVYFRLFKQPLIARITYLEDDEISILIGVNPLSVKEWRSVNLIKLAEKLYNKDNSIRFSGRRNVIRTKIGKDVSIEKIYKLLSDIYVNDLFDKESLFSIYK